MTSVFAAPAITWNVPVNNTHQWTNFTLNITTSEGADCTYNVTGAGGSGWGTFSGGSDVDHLATINAVPAYGPGYNYSLVVSCINSTDNAENTTEQLSFLRDPVCGETLSTNWTLGHNLTCDLGAPDAGIWLTGASTTLDCDGNSIKSTGSGYGVYASNIASITVKNCIFDQLNYGVSFSTVSLPSLINNTFTNWTQEGVFLRNSPTGFSIINNTFVNSSGSFAINLDGFSENIDGYGRVSGNTFKNVYSAIYMGAVSYTNVTSNTLISNVTLGIYSQPLYGSTGNLIANNRINTTGLNAFYIAKQFQNSTFLNNTILTTGMYGIHIMESNSSVGVPDNNQFINNTISGAARAFYLEHVVTGGVMSSLVLRGNNITNASSYGIYIDENIASLSVLQNLLTVTGQKFGSTIPYALDNGSIGNFWGYTNSCPGMVPGVDSDNLTSIDRYPYDAANLSSFACGCGDNVVADATLYSDVTCTGPVKNGLNITSSSVILNCSNHVIAGNGTTGIGLSLSADTISVTNCIIQKFQNGVYSAHTSGQWIQYSTLRNMSSAGILFNDVNDSILMGNSIYDNPYGLDIINNSDTGAFGSSFYMQNNIYNNSLLGLRDGGDNNVSLLQNYWGHQACPLYSYMVDSNSRSMVDPVPRDLLNGWSSTPINCSVQSNAAVFNTASLKLPTGAAPTTAIPASTYFYNSSGGQVYISSMLGMIPGYSVAPWAVYQYYYNPGQNILFTVNITPAHYAFSSLSVMTSSFTNYTLVITNTSGLNASLGTYLVNISNYTMNMSDPNANGSLGVRTFSVNFVTMDEQGAPRFVMVIGVYNFTPQQVDSSLGTGTTDWTTIDDYTSVSGLSFKLVSGGTNLTKLQFLDPVNLVDVDFVHALRTLGTYLASGNGSAVLDSSVLAPLNKTTNLTFYGVSVSTNVTDLAAHLSMNGDVCPSNICGNFSYNSTTGAFSVVVGHWTNYSVDYTAPTIDAIGPSGALSAGTTEATLYATTNEPGTCRYELTDVAFANMTNNLTGSSTTHTASLSVSGGVSYGPYYIRCRDAVNNTMNVSESTSFSVTASSASSGGRGGGGGGGAPSATVISGAVKTFALIGFGSFEFKLPNQTTSHTISLKSVNGTRATVVVRSSPQEVSLEVGQSLDIDVDGDKVPDMTLTLDSVTKSTAKFSVKMATAKPVVDAAQTPAPTPTQPAAPVQAAAQAQAQPETAVAGAQAPPVDTAAATAPDAVQDEAASSTKTLWWILAALVVVVVALMLVFGGRKRGTRSATAVEPPQSSVNEFSPAQEEQQHHATHHNAAHVKK